MKVNKVNSGLLEFSEDQKVFVALDAETSEVKKAVTIDGDGVETDIQGVQPSGKKEITSTAEVNVANYATAQVVDVDLVAGNIKKDVDILGVVGSYEPEAPASDFTTAEVTITNNTLEKVVALYCPNVIDIEESEEELHFASGQVYPLPSETLPIKVILYKGEAYANIVDTQGITSVITGDIVKDDETTFIITGAGTITFADANHS